ncbi:MAG TPA: DUF4251 domain-containing protein [Mucilaginibacter sp.]|nr:DUF4251 domain-containing protein [Mucilaginibacter sp.]
MKALRSICILLLIVSAGMSNVRAQVSKKDKKAAKVAAIKKKIESKHYTFTADFVLPQRGGQHQLTETYYDLNVRPDSVIAYLPYFGEVYFDAPYNPTDYGVKFTSVKFEYKVTARKKGGWEIRIVPKDVKNMDYLQLNISPDGYASLSVSSTNRDFITYDGRIEE